MSKIDRDTLLRSTLESALKDPKAVISISVNKVNKKPAVMMTNEDVKLFKSVLHKLHKWAQVMVLTNKLHGTWNQMFEQTLDELYTFCDDLDKQGFTKASIHEDMGHQLVYEMSDALDDFDIHSECS